MTLPMAIGVGHDSGRSVSGAVIETRGPGMTCSAPSSTQPKPSRSSPAVCSPHATNV